MTQPNQSELDKQINSKELEKEVRKYFYLTGYNDTVNTAVQEAVERLKALIRNEKLKLLAEVREQAQSMPIHGGTDSYSPSKYVQAVSIDALTKLEAEL